MKKYILAIAMITSLTSFTALAKGDVYYLKGYVGAGYVPNQKVTNLSKGNTVKTKGHGVLGGVALGYKFGSYSVRSDIEFYTDGGLKGKKNVYTNKLSTNAGFWNLYYDFSNHSKFTPFVQVGLGYASNKQKFSDDSKSYSKSKSSFAYKIGLGTSYSIATNFDAELAYIYMDKGAKSHTFNNLYRYKSVAGRTHALTAGFRFNY